MAGFSFSTVSPAGGPSTATAGAVPAFSFGSNPATAAPAASDGKKSALKQDEVDDDMDMEEVQLPPRYNVYYNDADAIDGQTDVPTSRLPYSDGPVPNGDPEWLKSGRHLDLAVNNTDSTGVVYASVDGEPVSAKTSKKADAKLYPFDMVPLSDKSAEKVKFLNGVYDDFDPLLQNKAYKNFVDDDMEIGVMSVIRNEQEQKMELLRTVITSMIDRLKQLIKQKIETGDYSESGVFNCEEVLNVLNLFNALHFAKQDERIILLQMWVNRANLQPDEKVIEEATQGLHCCENTTFWSQYIAKLVSRGYFEETIAALGRSGYDSWQATDPNLFNLVSDFETIVGNYDSMVFSEDADAFLLWKQSVVGLRDLAVTKQYKNMTIASSLQRILGMMSGYSSASKELTSNWYEYLLVQFLYELPSLGLIPKYLKKSVECFPVDTVYSWEATCLDLFEGKYLRVVSSLEALDKSVATYVALLMEASGLLKVYADAVQAEVESKGANADTGVKASVSSTIDKMVEDLALSYMTSRDLFAMGVGLLIKTNDPNARPILAELLPTFEITSNDDFEWVLSICAKLRLSQTAVKIYNIQGEELLEQGYEYESLECFAEAGNPDKVVESMWKVFENVLLGTSGDALLDEKIDKNEFVDRPILHQALAPYALLREIVNGGEKEHPDFDKLVELLEFQYLPAYYKPVLLMMLPAYFNTGTFKLEQLVEIVKVLNTYELQVKEKPSIAEQSQKLYSEALAKRKDVGNLPQTSEELILQVRKAISLEISVKFLDE